MSKHDDGVLIFVNKQPLLVQPHPHCYWSARGEVGLLRSEGLFYESGGHSVHLDGAIFYEDERFTKKTIVLGKPRGTRVWVNNKMLFVPDRVCCNYAVRGALGIPRGAVIMLERDPERELTFNDGWSFSQDCRFLSRGWPDEDVAEESSSDVPDKIGEEPELLTSGGGGDDDDIKPLISSDDETQPWMTDPNSWKPEGYKEFDYRPDSEDE